MVAKAKRRKEGNRAEMDHLCVCARAAFKNRAWLRHLDLAVSFLFRNQSRNFYELPTTDNIPGRDSIHLDLYWLPFHCNFKQDQQGRSVPGAERGEAGVISLPITCSFPMDKSFSCSVPGVVA